ncbi:MAG: formylglycine-generating enzyme family protein, partial [Myxococcota bacterium]|nr:formylglycine-generating enzyme family protein [Myxococcota bacterium]
SISPETPTAGQDPLVCTVDVESTDEDGDIITYSYEWLREGVVYPNYTTSILPPSVTQSGETWTCVATPFDGLNNGDSARDSVVISTCVLSECDMSLDLGDGIGVDFVEIPAGNFTMGSPTSEIGRSNDEVEHLVTLSNPFYMMTTEVTQGMFEQLSGYNPATYDTTYGIDTNYPVYYVNWHMAADFSNKMTAQHNQTHGTTLSECYTCSGAGETVSCDIAINPYSCDGYRLPTESEWEYSARAGTTKAIWTPYGGGDLNNTTASLYLLTDGTDLRDQSWYYVNRYDTMYYNTAKPVAQLQENSFGLHDMSGNLWEWTNDWYDYYPTDAQTDPVGPSSGVMRVIRGGFWCNSPYNLRSAKRIRFSPAVRIMSIGFRLVRTQ